MNEYLTIERQRELYARLIEILDTLTECEVNDRLTTTDERIKP